MASCRAEEVPRLPCAQNSIPLYFSINLRNSLSLFENWLIF